MPPEHDLPGLGNLGGQPLPIPGRPRYDDLRPSSRPSAEPPGSPAALEHTFPESWQSDEQAAPGLPPRARSSTGPYGNPETTGIPELQPPGGEDTILLRASAGSEDQPGDTPGGRTPGDPKEPSEDERAQTGAPTPAAVWQGGGYVHTDARTREQESDPRQAEVQRAAVLGFVERIMTSGDRPEVRTSIESAIIQRARDDRQGMSEFIDQIMQGVVSEDTRVWTDERRSAAVVLLRDYVMTANTVDLIDRQGLGNSYSDAVNQLENAPLQSAIDMHQIGTQIAPIVSGTAPTFMKIWQGWRDFSEAMPVQPPWLRPEQITTKINLDETERRTVVAEMAGRQRALTNDQIAEQIGNTPDTVLSGTAVGNILNRLSASASEMLNVPDLNLREIDANILWHHYEEAFDEAARDPNTLRTFYERSKLLVPFLGHTANAWLELSGRWQMLESSAPVSDTWLKASEVTSHLHLPPNERQEIVFATLTVEREKTYAMLAQDLGVTTASIERDVEILQEQGSPVPNRRNAPIGDLTLTTAVALLEEGETSRKREIQAEIDSMTPDQRGELAAKIISGLWEDSPFWKEKRKAAGLTLLSDFMPMAETDSVMVSLAYLQAMEVADPRSSNSVQLLYEAGQSIAPALAKNHQTWLEVRNAWTRIINTMPEVYGDLNPAAITSQMRNMSESEQLLIVERLFTNNPNMPKDKVAAELGIARKTVDRYIHTLSLQEIPYMQQIAGMIEEARETSGIYVSAITRGLGVTVNQYIDFLQGRYFIDPNRISAVTSAMFAENTQLIEDLDKHKNTFNMLRAIGDRPIDQAVEIVRLDNRWTEAEFAEQTSLTREGLNKIINGRTPSAEHLRELLDVAGIEPGSKERQYISLVREGKLQPLSSDDLIASDPGEIIAYLRATTGLNRQECAEVIGSSKGMLRKNEKGDTIMPPQVRAAFLRTLGLEEGSPLWHVFDARLAGAEMSLTEAGRREIQKILLVKEDIDYSKTGKQLWIPPDEQEIHDDVTQIRRSGEVLRHLRDTVLQMTRGEVMENTNNRLLSGTLRDDEIGDAVPEGKTIMEFMGAMGPQYRVFHPTTERILKLANRERRIIDTGRSGEILRYFRTIDKKVSLRELSEASGVPEAQIRQLEVSSIYHDIPVLQRLATAIGYSEGHDLVQVMMRRAEDEIRASSEYS